MPRKRKLDPFQRLVNSFHTLLDEPLIAAIASDFDLTTTDGFAAAKAVLQGLAQDVPSEEASGFNPSGVVDTKDSASQDTKDSPTVTSATSDSQRAAQQTDSSSSECAPHLVDASWAAPRVTSFNNNSDEDKALQLLAMFPGLKAFDVNYALKKCKGDFQSALDQLLNLQYLEETGQQTKGLDGFVQLQESGMHKAKGKGKVRRSKKSLTSDANAHDTLSTEYIKQAKEQTEIGYIAERFNLTFDAVSETYYDKNRSIGATVVEILDQRLSQIPSISDDENTSYAVEALARKYRHVPDRYLKSILHATCSISPFSEDLAKLVNKQFSKKNKGQKMDISYNLTPLPNDGIEGSTASSKAASPFRPATPLSPGKISSGPADFSEAIKMSQSLHQARREASASASHLYRKGASNPLYRQAAGYYADIAREHARYAQAVTSTAADMLVDEQSSGHSVDLHGVSVQDGTRIARQRATEWWQHLGEYKVQSAKVQPLVIITGYGRHSAGGVSQLRRSVAAALIQDGWKVEVGTGAFTIYGRR